MKIAIAVPAGCGTVSRTDIRGQIVQLALDEPELSPRELAVTFTDAKGYFISEASVCRVAQVWNCQPVRCRSKRRSRFPSPGGHHPVLDCLVATPSALIGIESKSFEPFREKGPAVFSDTYWRPVRGDLMKGYERVRDSLRENPHLYAFLDAAQLVKHAFALRSEVHRPGRHQGLRPILLYIYAEPEFWPRSGHPLDDGAKTGHRDEIDCFGRCVADDEVPFVSCSYLRLLEAWRSNPDRKLRAHAEAV